MSIRPVVDRHALFKNPFALSLSKCEWILVLRRLSTNGIQVQIVPVNSGCIKEPSLRGGAADAAIQKVFAGTDAALIDCHAPPALPAAKGARLVMTGQLVPPAVASPGTVAIMESSIVKEFT
jgi:hypothetical protein